MDARADRRDRLRAYENRAELESLDRADRSPRPASRRIKELEVMVADVTVETPDTSTLVLFTGNDRLDYKAGHFLTIDPTSSRHSIDSPRFLRT